MNTYSTVPRLRDLFYCLNFYTSRVRRFSGLLFAALILMLAGNVYAGTTVGLAIGNDIDSNGIISVFNGSKIEVAYEVIADSRKKLGKGDKIQLLRVDDDSIVSSVSRGKKKSGTVILRVKNSEDETLYIRYVRKGKSGKVIATVSHPSNQNHIPLKSIADPGTLALLVLLEAMKKGVTYEIGDVGPAGGWVFWVNESGRHGLEAAPMDQSDGIRWNNSTQGEIVTSAHGSGLGAGEMNTGLIVAKQGADSRTYAAGFCANLVVTSNGVDYSDWYLPSIYELILLAENFGTITAVEDGGLAHSIYWSSTEELAEGDFSEDHSKAHAWQFDAIPNIPPENRLVKGIKSDKAAIRAIRAF